MRAAGQPDAGGAPHSASSRPTELSDDEEEMLMAAIALSLEDLKAQLPEQQSVAAQHAGPNLQLPHASPETSRPPGGAERQEKGKEKL